MYLGIDTSNYTTSAALVDGLECRRDVRQLLTVAAGSLGLRQSDALFQHVKNLPGIVEKIFADQSSAAIRAVAASTRPREAEGSYMPCFLAGEGLGRSLASALKVPFYAFSHQQGHIAAVLFSAGKLAWRERRFLAWHLSGGTTELLLVEPKDRAFTARRIGGTTDISAGQLIDRTGRRLGLAFPSGREIDKLALSADDRQLFRVKTGELSFSFSGLENKMNALAEQGASAENVAYFVLRSVSEAVKQTTADAMRIYPGAPVLFSGGVSSSKLLRSVCAEFEPVFSEPSLSTDNAVGAAVLAQLQEG